MEFSDTSEIKSHYQKYGYRFAECGEWSVAWSDKKGSCTVFKNSQNVGSFSLPKRKNPWDGLKFCTEMSNRGAKSIVDAATIIRQK